MRLYVYLLILFLPSVAYAAKDSLWVAAEQCMQNRQYSEAAKLYEKIVERADSVYNAQSTMKIKDLRNTYSANELKLANEQQQNRLLLLAIIILPVFIVVAVGCIIVFSWQRKKLSLSQQRLQQARQEVESAIHNKSLFISNMSHEIRTPLNALSGFSEVLTTPGIDEETRKQCNDVIQLNSHLLLNLVNDVVDISCLDITNMQFDLKQCDAVDLCKGIVQTLEGIKQTQADIRFESKLPSLMIETDTLRLHQVLINLLVNATKFTKEGSIVLRLEQVEGGMAQFSVTDTGCGIPVEKQAAIFERFQRVDEKAQGTGLGLAICQLIINRLGGDIRIDSAYTQGCRFVFTHPLKQEDKA